MPAYLRREIYFGRPPSENTNSGVIWEFSIEQDRIEWRVKKDSHRKLLAKDEQFYKLEIITPRVTQRQIDRHFSLTDGRKISYSWGASGSYSTPRKRPSEMVYFGAEKNLIGVSPEGLKIVCLYDLELEIDEVSWDVKDDEIMACTGIGAVWLDYESGKVNRSNLNINIENLIAEKD